MFGAAGSFALIQHGKGANSQLHPSRMAGRLRIALRFGNFGSAAAEKQRLRVLDPLSDRLAKPRTRIRESKLGPGIAFDTHGSGSLSVKGNRSAS
jgi:hypothetical protein